MTDRRSPRLALPLGFSLLAVALPLCAGCASSDDDDDVGSQRTVTASASPTTNVRYEDHFADLSGFVVTRGGSASATITGSGYRGGTRLQLALPSNAPGHFAMAERKLGTLRDVLVRTVFHDAPRADGTTAPSLGTLFAVDGLGGRQTGLGVMTSVSRDHYVVRVDSASGVRATRIARTAGWHLFEIIVTSAGTFAKIDNVLVAQANRAQTAATAIKYVTSWQLPGTSSYDELRVVDADRDVDRQLRAPAATLYRRYGAHISGPNGPFAFSRLYTQNALGYCPSGRGCGTHSNDLRSLMNTALSFYRHGQRSGDATARQRGVEVFVAAWSNAPWKRPGQDVDNWARGAVMLHVTLAAHGLRDALPAATVAEIERELGRQVLTYRGRAPRSGYVGDTAAEENGWHAAFLAAAVNLFPRALSGADRIWAEATARCFAYHTLTTSTDAAYCGHRTQTVYDTPGNQWRLENHGRENPLYNLGALQLLAAAAFSYLASGQSIPWEMTHNAAPMYRKLLTYIDRATYHFVGVEADWSGCHGSAFIIPTVLRFMEVIGEPTQISWPDLLAKRSLFCHDRVSEWQDKQPAEMKIDIWNQFDPTHDAYKFFLDAVDSGGFIETALLARAARPQCPRDGSVIALRSRHNQRYVATGSWTGYALRAEGLSIGVEDKYRVAHLSDGTFTLRALYNNKLVAAGGWNDWRLRAEGSFVGIEDRYRCAARADGTITLRSAHNGKYIAAGAWNDWRLRAEGSFVGIEDIYEHVRLEP